MSSDPKPPKGMEWQQDRTMEKKKEMNCPEPRRPVWRRQSPPSAGRIQQTGHLDPLSD